MSERKMAARASDASAGSSAAARQRTAGKRPGRASEEVREAVRRTAARIFLEKGYRDTTIQDIADEVGMAKGSAYYHIGSKPEVLYDIVSDGMRGLVERLAIIVDYPLSAGDRLRLALRDNLRSTVEDVHAPVAIALTQELDALSDEHRAAYDALRLEYQELFLRLYRDGVDSGEFRELEDAKLVWFGIFGMLSYFQRWFIPDGAKSYSNVADIWLEFIMNGIGQNG